MRLRKYNKSLGILSLIAGAVLLSGCDSALLNPKGQIALEQRSLILTAFGLMMIVVIPAVFMAVFFAWKYRATNTNATYSPNWSHSNKVEAVVWTIPILIIIFLGVLTWKSTHALEPSKPLVSDVKPVEIDVVALDWKWLFIYPEQGIATVNQIAFPANTPVNFKITSNSVMNSFFIPTLGSQIYAMAGMQTKLHLIANEPGTFDGISANFSGRGFSGMKFKAIATKDDAEFQQWVAKVKAAPNALTTMDDFEKLAAPSENHPVEYFSTANPELFKQVIDKFMMSHGKMDMPEHKGMDMNHAAAAGAEE
ncbi:cytochrome o ubiquinol oxidase subunit II [Pantoea sp. JGM49]|jgi:cytochrome o ubiquinol oxidase subunit II|uniref:Ubiquinol oxidase subunit 2 n=2 Tax=Pantoea TaxID=53335 RepID=A0ABM5RMN2_9GAMM|nr:MULTISPECIES: cytochrome o ubiquinol oxidase subunit II [Enterobacterales]MDF7629567.1 cytochrome o ubiquinol oxidase subunit II [Erwiniaceae bacterium L1_55_4]HAU5563989.1 cytochrome o ubiquinol oxidase subunit II [Serratia fonticola]AIR87177.1 cytochrome o ubiquinol oxidase subunit II [Pantoea rwandensis]KGT88494.1 cytochrome o ubiquinol oxidase subunit II [Enterobacter cancerogenus]KJV35646.1 cytochrome o ubiquinol oxidase subunit II [Pantoea sp. SM3]